MSGTILPLKRSEGTLVERYDLDLMYLPFGSLGLFMKVNKRKIKSYHWVSRSIHESKQKQKEKTTIGFGGTCNSRCTGSYLSSQSSPATNIMLRSRNDLIPNYFLP
jgi:hypothetical protein